MSWNMRRLAAAMISAAFMFVSLSAVFIASILQADVCRECDARLDFVLFGATIAGPTLPLWPVVAAGIFYAVAFPKRWTRLAWTALPIGLMLLGDGLHHALSIWAGWLVTVPHGLALTWTGSGGVHLTCGGNLLATAGLTGGIAWLAKKTVFDALTETPEDLMAGRAE
ncbi:MAG: hypothetical protein ACOY5H_10715 [Pseudomonadota bacterium]